MKAKPEMHKKTFLKPIIKKRGVLLDLPQGRPAVRAEPLQGFRPRPGPLQQLPALGRLGPRRPELLLSAGGQVELRRVPHGPDGLERLRGQGLRRQGSATDPRPPLPRGQHRHCPTFQGDTETAKKQEKFLKDKKVRVDIFALREGGEIEGQFLGPLRPECRRSSRARSTWSRSWSGPWDVGHPFTQGTVDSNEIWVELIARRNDRVIGRSGGIDADGTVDPYSHFINVYMLDRNGNRIDRRNPQDIFVPLYNKQIPPGAGQVVHFGLEVPQRSRRPDHARSQGQLPQVRPQVHGLHLRPGQGPQLPVVVMARDAVKLPVEGGPSVANEPSPIKDEWQRWNDYGIGLLLEGSTKGGQKGELKQAEEVFLKVAELDQADGWVNLARVYQREGRIPDALAALEKAAAHKKPAAPWVINWLTGQINASNAMLDEAIASFEEVLKTRIPERKFDFSLDFVVINELARRSSSGPSSRGSRAPRRATG